MAPAIPPLGESPALSIGDAAPGNSAPTRLRVWLPVMAIGALVLLLVVAILGSINLISSVRSLVHGEALWSKAQKQAVLALHRMEESGDIGLWAAWEAAMAVPDGDRVAREELTGNDDPDMAKVMAGFRQGRVPEEALAGVAVTIHRYQRIPFVRDALLAWTTGDKGMAELEVLAVALRQAVATGAPEAERTALLQQIDAKDAELTVLEDHFSTVLHKGAVQVEALARWSLLGLVGLIVLASVRAVLVSRKAIARREQALDTSRRRYRGVIERVGDVLFDTTADGCLALVSPSWQRCTGFPAERVLGRRLSDMRCVSLPRELEQQLLDGERDSHRWEFQIDTAEGDRVVMAAEVTALWDSVAEARVLTGTLKDVTSQREAASRDSHRNRMEAMGQLAGGVAHDFNNMLTGIIGFTGMARDSLAQGGGQQDAVRQLDQVLRSAESAATLSRELLTFSKPPQVEVAEADLNQVVKDAAKLLAHLLPETILLETRLEATHGGVAVGPAQAEQLVMNLVINARDAMTDGGTVVVTTRNGITPEGVDAVVLQVQDNGVGMDEETLRRAFEPFFTTKDRHRGTGMGLATVYGIVSHAGGDVTVDSTPGHGSCFSIVLPALDGQVVALSTRQATPAALPMRNQPLALVVEDDPAVREMVSASLELHGYAVRAAGNGQEGLDVLRSSHRPDVVVSDVVMPICTGPAMWRQAQEEGITVPTLFMSGYIDNALEAEVLAEPTVAFLTKPFRPQVLLDAVDRLTERGRRDSNAPARA